VPGFAISFSTTFFLEMSATYFPDRLNQDSPVSFEHTIMTAIEACRVPPRQSGLPILTICLPWKQLKRIKEA
jgi:hypothetical protein